MYVVMDSENGWQLMAWTFIPVKTFGIFWQTTFHRVTSHIAPFIPWSTHLFGITIISFTNNLISDFRDRRANSNSEERNIVTEMRCVSDKDVAVCLHVKGYIQLINTILQITRTPFLKEKLQSISSTSRATNNYQFANNEWEKNQ